MDSTRDRFICKLLILNRDLPTIRDSGIGCLELLLSFLLCCTLGQAAQVQQKARDHYDRATQSLSRGDLEQAEKEILRVLQDFPDLPQALNVAGVISDMKGNPQRAIEFFKRSLDIRSDDFDARSNLARVYLRVKDYQKAQREFELSLSMQPNHLEANVGLAEVLYETDQVRQAQKVVTRAKRLQSENPNVLFLSAKIQFKLEDTEEAVEAAVRVSQLSWDNGEKWFIR